MSFNVQELLAVMFLRFKLLLRQKIGWVSLALTVAVALISFIFANTSFVRPEKIFLDFSLGAQFVLQNSLAIYLGTQLFSDEKNRKTLHLFLSSSVSRGSWLVGNAAGIFLLILLMASVSGVLTLLLFKLGYSKPIEWMPVQSILLGVVESFVLIAVSLLLSLFMRPLIALVGTFSLFVFLHFIPDLQKILNNPLVEINDFSKSIFSLFFWGSRSLPPLHYFDLKPLVGYEPMLSWISFLSLFALGLLWGVCLLILAKHRIEKLDL